MKRTFSSCKIQRATRRKVDLPKTVTGKEVLVKANGKEGVVV